MVRPLVAAYPGLMDQAVSKVTYVITASEVIADAESFGNAFREWMGAKREQREQWQREAAERRAAEREPAARVDLTLDSLLGKLGFSTEYAEHLVQPYCYCGDSADGWDYCEHARDLRLVPGS